MKTLEALTQEEISIVDGARIVARLWDHNAKNDKLTIEELIKAEVGTEEECQYLLDMSKKFVEKLGPIF